MEAQVLEIAGRSVGPGQPCYIIAEAGVNHNGDLALAHRMVDVAVEAGADAIKFQTFVPEKLVTPGAPKADYQVQATGVVESQAAMLKRLALSFDAFRKLSAYCAAHKILFMSTPFDEESTDFLVDLGVAVFKIPSGEITNLPFLAYVARKQKPMIVSTGMACLGEVETALHTLAKTGNSTYMLLHCVSSYPADPADVNLRAMHTLTSAFGVPVGFSDHTQGIEVSLAAVALGACVIEKHFTLDRNLPGPDQRASLEPVELSTMVQGIRKVEAALGHGRKEPAASERGTAAVARRSLVAHCDLVAGTRLREEHIAILRPGTGLPPAFLPYLLDRTLRVNLPAGALLSLEVLA